MALLLLTIQRDNRGMSSNQWAETPLILYLPLQQAGVVFILYLNRHATGRKCNFPLGSTPMVSIKNIVVVFVFVFATHVLLKHCFLQNLLMNIIRELK